MADLDKTFQLKIIGDITAYQAEMAKIPGVTEKQAAAAALRMEREMVKAARATGVAAQQAADGGAQALGKSFGQAKEQVALVAAGASRISPELGAAVNTASAALGVFKSMASPVGAITAAVTLGAAAWVKFSGDVDKAMDRQNDAAKAAIKAQLGIVDSANFLNKALEAQDKVSLLERKGQWIAFAKDYVEIWSLGGLNPIANAGLRRLEALEQAQASAIDVAQSARDRNIELAQASIDVAEAKKKEEEATKKATTAAKEAQQVAKEAAEQAAELVQAQRDEVQDKLTAQLAAIKKETAAKEKALDEEKDRVLAASKVNDRFHEQQRKNAEETAKINKEAAMASFDATGALAQAGFEAAKAMFGDSKEIAMAEAVVNTASAIVRALANPPGPPFSTAQAVAAGAMGAAQIATIASTNIAHSGLSMAPSGGQASRASDEVDFRLTKRERVLTGRGVDSLGGDGQVRRLNAGQSPSMGSSFVGLTHWKHQTLDKTIGANISRPAAVRTEIKAIAQTGGRVGHRLRSNT